MSGTPPCSATIQASSAADDFGLFPGHDTHQADARQACTQSALGGAPAWIRLPWEARPESWAGMCDPVRPLRLALRGRPGA
eukprot:4937729-Pyramimonas_sp.AAC.1